MVSFDENILLIFMKSSNTSFLFCLRGVCVFVCVPLLGIFAYPKVTKYPQIFSSGRFILPGLTFRSMIHVKFIFVYGLRLLFWCIFFPCKHTIPQYHCFKTNIPSPHWIVLTSWYKVTWLYVCESISELLCSIDLLFIVNPIPHCLNCYSFRVSLEI